MVFVAPIIANRRRYGRSGLGMVMAGLVLFLVFGIMVFFFFNRFGVFKFNFPFIYIILGFSVFLIIILGFSISAVATNRRYTPPRNYSYNDHYKIPQEKADILNPYKLLGSNKGQYMEKFEEYSKKDVPVVEKIIYCHFCGARQEKDAVFCHMCGTKL